MPFGITPPRAGYEPAGADYLPGRFYLCDRHYKDVETMRAKVDEGLEPGMFYALTYTITDLARQGRPIHPDTVDAYNWVLERRG